MTKIKYCYITKRQIYTNELCVEGKTANGHLLFGFFTQETYPGSWREQALRRVPSAYIPVFQANAPAKLRA
ncbi:hypothetical protein HER14_06545 [Acidithiobacillus thiooxidans]|uniref:Uncharacterized protein n=1 Tax=Acidithiobacillus thiooxidans ATCC 19377 TaxID=637390 RepID=A0A5P9XQA1_ACITH|nr:hypothetical protein [Acidithiobacillus thiooxidans]MBU2750609.1 hypothetical protein [Acidithiobacillus thiooxidans]MBU2836231.1 hypothetical protein [Acidithiobacillus thiooxidans]QFX96247.1 hypothetical protein GCD22_01987 [Acidithiobacillus thiooxidans ATCC 19377]